MDVHIKRMQEKFNSFFHFTSAPRIALYVLYFIYKTIFIHRPCRIKVARG